MNRYFNIFAIFLLLMIYLFPCTAWSADGSCGIADGTAVTEKPLYFLCADSSIPQVYGDGPWTWTCSGSNGGADASCSANIRSLNGLESYWPLHVGDEKTFSYGQKTLTTTVGSDGMGGYKLDTVSPDGSGSEYHQLYADKIRITKVKVGWTTVSFTPALDFLSEPLIMNGGTLVTKTSAKQTGVTAYPATFTVKVAMAGTVTVPAGTFHNCRSVTVSETATIPGQGTVNVSFMTAILAPKIGLIKKLVSPGVWAVLVSGTVGGKNLVTLPAAEKNPPIGTISINNNAVATSTTSVSLDIAASDATDVAAICISNTATCSNWQALAPATSYSENINWNLLAGDGTKNVSVWFRDSFWNISAPVKASITLDTKAPTFAVTSSTAPATATERTINGTKEAKSTITATLNGTPVTVTQTFAGTSWSLSLSNLNEGSNTLVLSVSDLAGNNGNKTVNIIKDSIAPAGTILIKGTEPTDSWSSNVKVPLQLACNGTGSDCAQMRFSNDNTSWSKWEAYRSTRAAWPLAAPKVNGEKIVYVQFMDAAGNISTDIVSDGITLDTVPPQCSIVINGGAAITNNKDLTLTLGATDTLSGVAEMQIADNASFTGAPWEPYSTNKSYTLPKLNNGTKNIFARFRDTAGNVSLPVKGSITFDTVSPALTIAAIPPTIKDSVTISGTKEKGAALTAALPTGVTCDTSAVTSTATTWSCTASGYGHNATTDIPFTATDAAGNSKTVTATVVHDTTPPIGTLLVKGTEPTDTYTNKTAVALNLTCDGTVSACNQMRFRNGSGTWSVWEAYKPIKAWTLLVTNGEQAVSVELKDAAGVTSTTSISDTIILDTLAPQTTIGDTKPPALTSDKTPAFSFSANEEATFECKMDTGAYASCTSPYTSPELKVGAAHTFTVRAKDTAGNYDATPAIYSFTVKNDQVITFAPIEEKTYGDVAFKLTATSDSGLAVTYTSSNTSVATISGNVVTIRGAGTTIITAIQAGNAKYLAATPVEQILTVAKRPITVNLMKTSFADASSPSIAMASDGRAIAVWSEGASTRTLWANHYMPDSGWGTAYSVGTGVGDEAGAKVAVNSSGLAVMVWVRWTDDSKEVLAATYNPATGWSMPTVLDSTQIGNPDITVLIDGDGSAAVFWQRFDSVTNSHEKVMTSRHTAGGWETPQQMLSETSTSEQIISGNSSGELFAIWDQVNPDPDRQSWYNFNTFVNSYKPGVGWSSFQSIGNNVSVMSGGYYNSTTTPGHYNPRISIDSQGNAAAIWSEVYNQNDDYQITVNGYNNGSGWGTPLSIGSIATNSTLTVSPFVTNDSGSFYVSLADCQYSYSSTLSNIFVASYKTGTGWSLDKIIASLPYFCHCPLITVGKNGNLYLTWLQIDGNETHLWLKKYSPLSGWGISYRIDNASGTVGDYEAVRDSSGNALIIWTQDSGAHSVVFAKRLN